VSDEERARAETAGGYARDMGDDYKRRQAALIDERARASDMVITTALIPGRPAPVLLPEATVRGMKRGSVIVDLAAEQGGNCALTVKDASTLAHGIVIIGHTNLPALVAADASALYARNILSFLNLLLDPASGEIRVDRSDEIVSATLICTEGASVRRQEMSPA
jgi:NAD(P) transhydrogenase subunit alpha